MCVDCGSKEEVEYARSDEFLCISCQCNKGLTSKKPARLKATVGTDPINVSKASGNTGNTSSTESRQVVWEQKKG